VTIEADTEERARLRAWLARARAHDGLSQMYRMHAVSTMADACITVSLAGSLFFSVSVDAAQPRLTLYLLLTLAPFAAVAPVIGRFADRFGTAQRRFLAFTGQARAILALFMAIDLKNLLLYPESFAVLVLGKSYAIVKRAMIPSLVASDDELVRANAVQSRVGSIAGAVGGAAAAGVLALGGPVAVLRIGAILHLVAAALALRIQRNEYGMEAEETAASELAPEPNVKTTRSLQTGEFAMANLRIAAGMVTFVVAFALKRDGAPAIWFGAVALTATIASFLGTFVSPVLRRSVTRELVAMAVCLLITTVGAFVAALQAGRFAMVLAATTAALGGSAARHLFDSVVQRELDEESARRRAFGRSEALFQLAWVAGAIIPTATSLDTESGYLITAAVCGIAALLVLGRSAIHERAARHTPV
jgi:hypothetical protein